MVKSPVKHTMLHKDARKKHSRKRILRSIHCAMIRVVTVSNLRTFPSKLSLRQICSHAALQVLMLYPTYFVKRLIPALTYFRDWRVLEKMQRQADQGHRIEYQILIPQGNWIDLFRSGRMICFSFRCQAQVSAKTGHRRRHAIFMLESPC